MEIQKLLQYQEIDTKLYRMEVEFSKHKIVSDLKGYMSCYKDKVAYIQRLSKELKDTISGFSKIEAKLDGFGDFEMEMKKDAVDEVDSLEELAYFDKLTAKYRENLESVEKEASRALKRINDIKAEIQKQSDIVRSIQAKIAQLKNEHAKMQQEMQKEAMPLVIELKKLAPEIDKTMLAKYLELRKARIMPAFVPYRDGNCYACGMNILVEVEKHLKSTGDYAECPHCRRMVYLESK